MSKQYVPFECRENSSGLTVRLYKPTTRYFDEFLNLKCAPDLVRLKLYPNGKEVTESFAMYRGIVRLVGPELLSETVTLVDVGCGKQPRNAALFAHRSRWNCIAIDPNLDPKWEGGKDVERLECYRMQIERYRCDVSGPVIVAMVHAHVDIPTVLRSFNGIEQLLVVSMPCCVPSRAEIDATLDYYDHGCWSPHRQLFVWDLGFGIRKRPSKQVVNLIDNRASHDTGVTTTSQV